MEYTAVSHMLPSPHMQSLPHYPHSPPDGTFVTTDEPKLTHDCHPKSTVYIRVRSRCCTFYGFGQMYPSLRNHTEYFHSPENPPCSAYSSLPDSELLVTTDLFIVPIVLPFSECRIVRILQYVAFSD